MISVLRNIKSIMTKQGIIFTYAQYEVNYNHNICLITCQYIISIKYGNATTLIDVLNAIISLKEHENFLHYPEHFQHR